MPLENPRGAFNRAVTRFNGKNLFDLWSISCIFSCIEYFDSWEGRFNFLFPTIYAEKVALFHRAILQSSSVDYKRDLLAAKDVPYVFNSLNEATSERTILLQGSEDATVRIRRLLSTMAHQQIRLQESNFLDRLGRTFAMLHDIPSLYKDEIKAKQGAKYIDLPSAVKQHLGLSVTEFLVIGHALIALMKMRYDANITISDDIRSYTAIQNTSAVKRRAEVISDVVETSRSVRTNFTFTVQDLVLANHSALTLENTQKYLDLLSKTTRQLRDIVSTQKVYSEGLIPDRLSPLERYPIVALDGSRYIIPNLRHFDTAVTDIIHYILQDIYPDNAYNQLRGYVQEIYLRMYLQDRLPQLQLIPEISYRKAKNRVEGPDLTAIDIDREVLVAIESKAKRMRVVSRVHPGTNFLMEDLQGALAAFEKLPVKIQDLYAGLPEYSVYQSSIDRTKSKAPIAVVVLVLVCGAKPFGKR